MGVPPRIAILMASFNGERFISKQLESIAAQHYKHWDLWVSDDGSVDATLALIKSFAGELCHPSLLCAGSLPAHPLVFLYRGPGKGIAANFYSLVDIVYKDAFHHYQAFAFCDQDDIWFSDKLVRAMQALRLGLNLAYPVDAPPTLYCTEVQLCDQKGELKANSITKIPVSFKPTVQHALTQNIVRGNTCVFNREGFEQIYFCRPRSRVVMHDWWFYIVMMANPNGKLIHDARPSLAYRQHEANQVGEPGSMLARFRRRKHAFEGIFIEWNDMHLTSIGLLRAIGHDRLGKDFWDSVAVLQQVCDTSRTRGFGARLKALLEMRQAKLRRIGWLQNLFLDLLILIKRY